MRKTVFAIAGCLILAVTAAGIWIGVRHEPFPNGEIPRNRAVVASPLAGRVADEISHMLLDYREIHGLPSLSVAIGLDGELVLAEAVGYADLDTRRPATVNTLYRVGSVSKSITAVALAGLVEDGLIELDAKLRDYVPEFPAKRWPFTLRQLASHTAGIRHYHPGFLASLSEKFHATHYSDVRDALIVVENDPLMFEPGSRYGYSSYGYNVLSAAMQSAAGTPFAELLERYTFTPAGMTTAHAENVLAPHPETTGYYLQLGQNSFRAPDTDNSYQIAGAGILATPSELVAFGNRLLDGSLMSDAMRDVLFTPVALRDGSTAPQNYGLGFRITTRDVGGITVRDIAHGGSIIGGKTYLLLYPDQNLVIAATMNITTVHGWAHPEDVAYAIADRLVTGRTPDSDQRRRATRATCLTPMGGPPGTTECSPTACRNLRMATDRRCQSRNRRRAKRSSCVFGNVR